MSVIWRNERGWIVCHSSYLHQIYSGIENERPCSACGKYRVFHIDEPFLKRGQKNAGASLLFSRNDNAAAAAEANQNQDQDNDDGGGKATLELGSYSADDFKLNEIAALQTLVEKFMRDFFAAKVEYFDETKCPHSLAGNSSAIDVANAALTRATRSSDDRFDGGNSNEHAVVANWKEEAYLIPPRCRFYNYDVEMMSEKLGRVLSSPSPSPPYDFILIDPPWQNKHVKRKNASSNGALGYHLMEADRLAGLPIDECLSADGLLAVWCTNSAQHIDELLNRLFPRWNVQYVCTWYWIKVTRSAQPICEFSLRPNKKQPFERIIFACRPDRHSAYKNPPPNKILVSVPSAIHSHKPPLVDVLKEYVPANGRCIEVFARYLLPGWTSYGNEVLKLQSTALFS